MTVLGGGSGDGIVEGEGLAAQSLSRYPVLTVTRAWGRVTDARSATLTTLREAGEA